MARDALLADAGEQLVDVRSMNSSDAGAKENIKIPVRVVALEGVKTGAVLGGGEERLPCACEVRARGRHGMSLPTREW